LRVWRPGGQLFGLALVRYVAAVCLILAVLRVFAGPLNIRVDRWPTMWYGTEPLGLPRDQVGSKLQSHSGKQLAIVRYAVGHNPVDEWVYNSADIDAAQIVWAREMDAKSN